MKNGIKLEVSFAAKNNSPSALYICKQDVYVRASYGLTIQYLSLHES